jgi:parvulin-like peptidyl-prolyl isomerase
VYKRFILGCVITVLLAGCTAGPTVQPDTAPGATIPPAATTASNAATAPASDVPLAAKINGEPIYMAVFENEVARRMQALTDQGLNTPESAAEVRSQALTTLIENKLIEQAAAQMGIMVTDADVDAVIQQDINNSGGPEAFNQWLANNGMTIEEHRAAQRTAMLTNLVRDRITTNVPTEAEQVHARYIQVLTEDEANQVLNMLKAGADFGALAQQYSKDPLTSVKGGDLGWFPRNGLADQSLEEAAFALQPGQTSGLVRSEFGEQVVYEIVQVLERKATHPLSVDRLMFLQRQTFLRWLDDLKATAKIEQFVTP